MLIHLPHMEGRKRSIYVVTANIIKCGPYFMADLLPHRTPYSCIRTIPHRTHLPYHHPSWPNTTRWQWCRSVGFLVPQAPPDHHCCRPVQRVPLEWCHLADCSRATPFSIRINCRVLWERIIEGKGKRRNKKQIIKCGSKQHDLTRGYRTTKGIVCDIPIKQGCHLAQGYGW